MATHQFSRFGEFFGGASYLFWSIELDGAHAFSCQTLSYLAYHGLPPTSVQGNKRDTRASANGESVTTGDGVMPSSGGVYDVCQYT